MREQVKQHLAKHTDLTASEIAEDLDQEVIEVEEVLNEMRHKGEVVEIYDCRNGYVWSVSQ